MDRICYVDRIGPCHAHAAAKAPTRQLPAAQVQQADTQRRSLAASIHGTQKPKRARERRETAAPLHRTQKPQETGSSVGSGFWAARWGVGGREPAVSTLVSAESPRETRLSKRYRFTFSMASLSSAKLAFVFVCVCVCGRMGHPGVGFVELR